MKTCHLVVPALVIAFGLSIPGLAIARGGHSGGGHSGGGHSGGGSTAGGHGGGGQGSSGQSGGHAAAAPAPRGPAVASSPAAPATTPTGQPTTTSGRSGGTVVGTAVPRGSVIGPFTPLGSPVALSRTWPYYGAAFGGLGLYGGLYNPFGFGYGYGYPPAFGYGYGVGYGYGLGGYGYSDGFGYPYGGGLGYGGGYGYPNSYADNVFGSSPDSGFSVERSDPGLGVDRSDSVGADPVGRPDRTFGADAYQRDSRGPAGGLRLKIEPRNAEVYVDGDYAGVVDDFDGRFQQLKLAPGLHHIELRAPGHPPLKFDVNIQSRQTTVYEGTFAP
jgi:hypothetical protein